MIARGGAWFSAPETVKSASGPALLKRIRICFAVGNMLWLVAGAAACAQTPAQYNQQTPAVVYGSDAVAGPFPADHYGQAPQQTAGPQPQFSQAMTPPAVPQKEPHAQLSTAWFQLAKGRDLVRCGQAQQALPLINNFIAAKPMEPEGYFWQGVALDILNQSDRALDAYAKGIEQVMKAGMDSAELRLNAANILLKKGKTTEAIDQYRRAAEIDPGLALVQLNLGRALIRTGDTSGALACFQRCEELRYEPVQLAYYRAKAFLKAGKTDDARAQVRIALSKLPAEHEAAKKIKQEFADLLEKGNDGTLGAR